MKTLLIIRSSLSGEQGLSSQLAEHYRSIRDTQGYTVKVRDLSVEPIPHLDGDGFAAFSMPEQSLSAKQAQTLALSNALIKELKQTDELLITAPMYNFGMPSSLKAYFGHIARAGVSFRYTDNGPQGLLGDKPVRVISTRGGAYLGSDSDSQTQHLRSLLGLLGFKTPTFIYAENLNRSGDAAAKSIDAAKSRIDEVTAAEAA